MNLPLSNSAKQTAKELVEDLYSGIIDSKFEFILTSKLGGGTEVTPILGINDKWHFRVPLLHNLKDLEAAEVLTVEVINSMRNTHLKIQLEADLLRAVLLQFLDDGPDQFIDQYIVPTAYELMRQLRIQIEILRLEREEIVNQRNQIAYELENIIKPQIFISYSRDDVKVKDDIVSRLRRIYGSSNVWSDEMLLGGQKWWDDILERISSSSLFIYLLSNESISSKYCKAEFQEAMRLRKLILPIKVRRTVTVPSEINQYQIVDMPQGINIENFADLIASINYLLSHYSSASPVSPEPISLP